MQRSVSEYSEPIFKRAPLKPAMSRPLRMADAGLQYKLTENVALTGEYERYGKKKMLGAKADAFTVGLKYGF